MIFTMNVLLVGILKKYYKINNRDVLCVDNILIKTILVFKLIKLKKEILQFLFKMHLEM